MKAKYLFVLSLFIGLASCSENKGNKTGSDNIDLESAIKNAEDRRKIDPNASGDNQCLLDYQSKYDQLLSEDNVITVTGFSKDVMETESSTVLKNPEYHSFEYKFNNGRMRNVPLLGRDLQIPDVVSVKSIKAISLAEFESTYRAISDEEMEVAKDALIDAAEGKSGEAEANEAVKKAEELNLSKEQVKDIGGGIMDAIKEVSKGYRIIENLGDAARWNLVSYEIYVLQNGVQFVILCDVSDDNEKNRSVAIDLAKIILNKCQ
ncbi:hypothetical protein ACFCT7_00500 [Fulvivirgaceae bacterium LMO-SS25]